MEEERLHSAVVKGLNHFAADRKILRNFFLHQPQAWYIQFPGVVRLPLYRLRCGPLLCPCLSTGLTRLAMRSIDRINPIVKHFFSILCFQQD